MPQPLLSPTSRNFLKFKRVVHYVDGTFTVFARNAFVLLFEKKVVFFFNAGDLSVVMVTDNSWFRKERLIPLKPHQGHTAVCQSEDHYV